MEFKCYLPLHFHDLGLADYIEVPIPLFMNTLRLAKAARPNGALSLDIHVIRFIYAKPMRCYYLRHFPQSYNIMHYFDD